MPMPTTEINDAVEDAVRSCVKVLLPELERQAKANVELQLKDTDREIVELRRRNKALLDRAMEAEAAALEIARLAMPNAVKDVEALRKRWELEDAPLDPSEGLLGRAVEAAIMLCSNDNAMRADWLRRRGWVQRASASDLWTAPTPGAGAISRSDAIKSQVLTDLKPFEYLRKR